MINIYTDGACKGNPGAGGWGALIIEDDNKNEIFGGEADTTNNRMEILAVIMALKTVNTDCAITIFTDSTYVQKGISEWIAKWKVNGWRTSNKKNVKNKDLWVQLDGLTSQLTISWMWVKGHSGHPGNERADYLANKGVNMESSIL
ncbi:ribonuclease HI [Methylophilaceae bacterium]|jgi:ribonuclease HI|nr:ribonuclease HI [Methylophilaceae bacterium]|tara:strand:- start:1660 stop:2097 length:438 start_codon:yes stop_codon:yes gene_type:complete